MATTVVVNSTFAGKLALPYFSPALLGLHSLTNGMFTVKSNIEGTAVVPTLALSGSTVQDSSCDFTPVGTVTKDERLITPKLLDISKQICKNDFLNDWEVSNMLPGAKLGQPKTFVDQLIAQMLGVGMAQLEGDLYTGATGNSGEIDGLETLLTVDAALPAAQEVTGTTVTALNVIDEIGKVLTATPDRVRDQADYHIGVSSNIFYLLVRALGGFAAGNIGGAGVNNQGVTWHDGRDSILFEGVPVLRCPGMSADVMLASYTSQVWFGTSLMSDLNSVSTLDMFDHDLSRNIRFLATYFASVQYGSATEFVTYGIVNAAN
jgi:hypothetical protein